MVASGPRLFAAVCAISLAAFGTIACSNSLSTIAPLQAQAHPAPAAAWPSAGSDPSLPSAEQVFHGRVAEPHEPASTF